jgi:hypothetical protein
MQKGHPKKLLLLLSLPCKKTKTQTDMFRAQTVHYSFEDTTLLPATITLNVSNPGALSK